MASISAFAEQPRAEPAVGEAWAYRARATDPLVQVVVVRIGVRTPRRIFIRFVDDEFEGLQDWVPPTRLKVRWPDVPAFIAREARWEAVLAASPSQDSVEDSAVGVVFDVLIDPALATLGYNATNGVTRIADVPGLAAHLHLDPGDLTGDPSSFEEDRELRVPWPTTLSIAKRAAELNPDAVLRYIEREEAEARRDAIYGREYRGRGKNGVSSVSPETCAQVDEEHGRPVRAILREWCGAEAIVLRDELGALRSEVRRLTRLVETAVEDLRRANARRDANRLVRELSGQPAESGRTSGRRTALLPPNRTP